MSKQDYYEVLGVTRDVDAGELKRAYRKMALKYHPDRNAGDQEAEERFKQAAEAYGVLSDPQKRKIYDTHGHRGLEGGGFQGFGGFEDIFSNFGDIFGDIFGGGRARARQGSDLRYDLSLSFQEAAFGTSREISFKRHEHCSTCDGSGARPGTSPTRCGSCGGAGRVQRQQGFFMVQTTCPVCKGKGSVIADACGTCRGEGLEVVDRSVEVKIPAGIDDGMRMRVAGEGESGGQGGRRGDLYVFIEVEPHDDFVREGADVHATLDVTFSQSALGGEFTVETLQGPQKIKLPAGTQPGTEVRLRRKGIARIQRGGVGDHYVHVNLEVPTSLSKAQKKLLAELAESGL
jgi:molecular chaperone DnaJ